MISKKARQGRILEIVRKASIRSQEELSAYLSGENVPVTQSTLSRDIRELGLIKVRGTYQPQGELLPGASDGNLRRTIGQFVISTAVSGNIVVIKTSPGNAHSVCVVIDAALWPEVVGTIAGDDTIFVLARDARYGKAVLSRIRDLSS
jgi:transcriptional regulator of arginine metabolism